MLIRRTKKCQYRRLLNKHCPDPSAYLQAKKNSSSMIDVSKLLWDYLFLFLCTLLIFMQYCTVLLLSEIHSVYLVLYFFCCKWKSIMAVQSSFSILICGFLFLLLMFLILLFLFYKILTFRSFVADDRIRADNT